MKTQQYNTNENLLLTSEILQFRNEHPETVQLWERQLGTETAGPDLHFCYHALEEFKNLLAQLDSIEYRIGFAINAHILHSRFQQRFIVGGQHGPIALEQANAEIRALYTAFDQQEPSGKAALLKSLQDS